MTVFTNEFFTDWQVANGVNKNWSYDFKIMTEESIFIDVRIGADGPITRYDSDFEWVATGENEGYVTYPQSGAALPAGQFVRIVRNVPYEQPIEIGNEGPFHPELHEQALDALTMQTQQLADGVNRAVKVPLGSDADTDDLAQWLTIVADHIDEVGTVAGISGDVSTVANNNANVAIVAGNITQINNVSANITAVQNTASISAQVTNVGNNMADVVNASANMAAIQAAPAAAAAAQAWAINPEDVPVTGGLYSAYHWAMKAAASVASALAGMINGAPTKGNPADDDRFPLTDSADGYAVKRTTWASIKAALSNVFLTLGGTGQQTMTRRTTFQGSTGGIAVVPWGGEQIEIAAKTAADVAFVAFHIPGIAAANFGMGADSQFRRGGKGVGAVSHLFWDHGNVNVGGFAVPTAPTASGHVATKGYVDAGLANKAGVHTGSGANATDFPVGHTIWCEGASGNRNATITPRLDTGDSTRYVAVGLGDALAGTWRMRGFGTTAAGGIAQRTA